VLGSSWPVFNLHDDALDEQVIPMDSPLDSDSVLSWLSLAELLKRCKEQHFQALDCRSTKIYRHS
jgi:hypothetical protein